MHLPRIIFGLLLAASLSACGSAAPSAPAPGSSATSAAPASAAKPAPSSAQASAAAKPAASASASQKPQASGDVRMAYVSLGGTMSPLWFAQDGGYFKQAGVAGPDPQLIASQAAVAALNSGEIQFLQVSGTEVINGDLSGLDLVMIAAPFSSFVQQLLARPEIKSATDLKGKKIGVSGAANADGLTVEYVLRKNFNMVPKTDYTMVPLADPRAKLAALRQGQIDAELETQPTTIYAVQQGMTVVVDLARSNIPFAAAGLVATRRSLKANPDLARRVVSGYVAALKGYKERPADAKAAIKKYSKIDDDAIIDKTYEYHAGILNIPPLPVEAAFQTALTMLEPTKPEAAKANPSDFFDASLVKAAAG